MNLKPALVVTLIFCCLTSLAQDSTSSDGLFAMARTAAFGQKDYPAAIRLSKKALEMSPRYTDIRVFLGRVFAWDKQYDSARTAFEYILAYDPAHEDASAAYSDLEYWNDQYESALSVAEKGLQHHPGSEVLLLKKAKALRALRRYDEAAKSVARVLAIDRGNTEARAFWENLREELADNRVGISYDFTHFDKQFSDPWHMASLDYGRRTKAGTFAFRLNYGNRFTRNGLQYEADFYPRINKTFYAYLSFGYSSDVGVFPKYRGGFSLYANLPKSFEAEVGTRYLYFSDPTWIYTVYLGKYYRNFLFGARAYLTPSENNISQSYNASARYYYGGTEDFLHLNIGTGISPDDRPAAILLNSNYKLKSNRVSLSWRKSFAGLNSFSLNAGWVNSEYLPKTRGNQYTIGAGYQRRF